MNDFSLPGPAAADLVGGSQQHFARLQQLQERIGAASTSGLSEEQRAGFAKAAKGFESMFVSMMMKQMRQSMLDKEDGEEGDMSFGAETLEGYTDLQFADHIAATGGIGIAQQVYEFLTGGERLPVQTQQTGTAQPPKNAPAPAAGATQAAVSQAPRGNFLGRVTARLQPYEQMIAQASQRYDVPVALIKGIITAESAGNASAQSGAGAKGLMQLMDGTARDLGVRDSFDPLQNIMGGTRYIRSMLDMFGDERTALAAYNAGPGNVKKYNGIPPFSETQAYVRNVLRYAAQYRELEVSQTIAAQQPV